jgi:hypothetical protein
MNTKNGVFEIVTGKNEREEHVFSVIVKRSYLITDEGVLKRRVTDHELRKIDAYYENGDPEWSVVQYEHDLAPYKPLADVVVIGKAHAPGGQPVQSMYVSVQVGKQTKKIIVFGDRQCRFRKNADPVFSEPEPFTEMEIRYDLAYGGHDEETLPESPFHYPRNFMGKGVVLRNIKKKMEGLPLPNIEDPNDLLTPERVIIGEPERWHLQPIPQGFGWRQRTWYPRSALLGSYPAFTDVGTVTAEEKMGYVPKNHIALAKQFRLPTFDAHFNNGASLGMSFKALNTDEEITLSGLTPEGSIKFQLPGDVPEIVLDIGRGEQQPESRLHTVSIRPDDKELDLIWRGSCVYEGYSWWPKMQRLHAEVN